MKSIKLASLYFLLAYLISTIVVFTAYLINDIVMWVLIFTLMPVIFGYFFYFYLKKTECDLAGSLKETNLLIVFWIIASLLLDGIVYIVIVPLFYDYNPSWIFFTDHISWEYLNYGTIIIAGYISRYVYVKKLTKQ